MILSPTSEISHHHKVTNITVSPTSLSPLKTYLMKIKKIISNNILNLFLQLIVSGIMIAFILNLTERNRIMESDEKGLY